MAVIKIENLNYRYPETETPALKNIDLEIPEGQFVLLVGGSGCGKSTLLRALAGLVPDFYGGKLEGKIYFDRQEMGKIDRQQFVQKVGMVFQDPESQLVMTDVEMEIFFGLENAGASPRLMKRRVMEVSEALGLSDYLHSFIPELSGGEKQKVALAGVMALQPEILLLDEPTSQLDPVSGEEILNMARRLNEENGVTVVLVEQRLERCLHLADRIIVMDQGGIVFDGRDAAATARWALRHETSFIPPLVRLFAGRGFQDVPVTVKEGRRMLRSLVPQGKISSPVAVTQEIDREKEDNSSHIVEVKNLWFTYANGREIIKNLNMKIKPGTFTVLMGENGAGKTTLLQMLNGLIKPGRGQVSIFGKDTRSQSVEELAVHVGYLSQDPNDYLFLPTVRKELFFTLKNLGLADREDKQKAVEETAGRLGLAPYLEKNPRDLSSGERQRVALASVLVARPQLLLLDEPTRGLDYRLKEELGNILIELKEAGTAIFMITHDVEFAAEYAQDIILMSEGTIVDRGSKYQVLTDSTFYASQVSKLFKNIADHVVTLAQGEELLEEIFLRGEK
ncbi:MAG: energy-coupling factor transporter ATPase [Desulfitobacteriaceae bacterium]|nr:energy-coupling factor transporter ATPase [Desulfitobacteriaceae bacterium]